MLLYFQLAASASFLIYLWFRARHFVHMLQLNSYYNSRFLRWAGKNRTLPIGGMFALLALLLLLAPKEEAMPMGLICLYWLLILFHPKKKEKKPFVHTRRTTRLFVTIGILSLAAACAGILGKAYMPLVFVVYDCLLFLVVCLANLINRPVEKMVANHYVADAKKILKGAPNLTVIGITGSFGKTGTKHLLYRILSQKYNVFMTPGSFNTPMGVVRAIREGLRPTHEIFLVEMGAKNKGDIKEICDIVHPKHGVITAIGEQHLETFKSVENVLSTKWELADAVLQDGMLFINADNDYLYQKNEKNAIGYGTSPRAAFRAEEIFVDPEGIRFTFVTPDNERTVFKSRLLGRANVINITGAAAVAYRMGVPLEDIAAAVRALPPVPHRLELLNKGAYQVIDDAYNSNPEGAAIALETLASFDTLRILVTPGMVELGEKQESLNREFGRLAAKSADVIILVGEKAAKPIAEGVRAEKFPEDKLFIVPTIADAFLILNRLAGQSEKKPVVLLENDLPDNYL